MMTDNEILKHIDHTQLKPFATWKDIEKLCEEAIQYQTASVCIPPAYIKRVHEKYGEKINICKLRIQQLSVQYCIFVIPLYICYLNTELFICDALHLGAGGGG